MKTIYKFLSLFVLLAMLLMPTSVAFAKGLQDGKVVFGESYTLESGETLNGDLVVMGGAVEIQSGAMVDGSVVVMGGSLDVAGTIADDMVLIGGVASVKSTGVVEGDVVTVGGTLQQETGAVIRGTITHSTGPEFNFENGNMVPLPETQVVPQPPDFDFDFNPFWTAFSVFGQAVLLGLLAALVAVFLPNATDRVRGAAASQPLVAGGMGCMTLLLAPMVFVILGLLSVFIITIPITVSLIGIIALALAAGWVFGTIALGLEVGRRLARAFRGDWPLPLEAGVGTFLLSFVVNAIGNFLFCFGWWAPLLAGLLALGAVVMTRFGTQAVLPGNPEHAPVSPAPVSSLTDDEPLPPAS